MSTATPRPMIAAMLLAERDVAQAEAELLEGKGRRDEHRRTVDTLRQILKLVGKEAEELSRDG